MQASEKVNVLWWALPATMSQLSCRWPADHPAWSTRARPQSRQVNVARARASATASACSLALCLSLASLSSLAAQASPDGAQATGASGSGPLLGEAFSYERLWWLPRGLVDVVAIPAQLPTLDSEGWAKLTLAAIPIGALMVGPDPSLDVRAQRWVNRVLGEPRFRLWTGASDPFLWVGLWSPLVASFIIGHLEHRPELLELVSLSFESLIVVQTYQLGIKLLLGREGPENGDGLGRILGPAWGYRLLPAGTPSGHAATLYGLIGVADTYFALPWLSIVLHTVGAALALTLVTDDYHYVSDVLWGAGMGYGVGHWIVRHRSTRRRSLSPLTVAPMPNGVSIIGAL